MPKAIKRSRWWDCLRPMDFLASLDGNANLRFQRIDTRSKSCAKSQFNHLTYQVSDSLLRAQVVYKTIQGSMGTYDFEDLEQVCLNF
jgi:hypothetical protein